ncbi:MAG: gamma carbonic anhydrase family protein [Bacteriovorax sp.]|nr:gamma carbonic anhydrase family protein [Bacteriovorax sp.]
MPLYSFKGIHPKIHNGVFIAPSADVIGKVILDENASLWHQCVARGDVNTIHVGKNTNVQDLTMLHVTKDFALTIGDQVSIGHSVTLHGCTIGNHCLIGMGAIILDGAIIGDNSVVAAGSLVPPGKVYPPGSMIMGNPAVVKRTLSESERELYGNHYTSYVGYKDEYLDSNQVKLIIS